MEKNQVNGREGFLEEVRSELVSLKEKTISTGIKGQKPSGVKGGVSKGTKQVTQGWWSELKSGAIFLQTKRSWSSKQTDKEAEHLKWERPGKCQLWWLD